MINTCCSFLKNKVTCVKDKILLKFTHFLKKDSTPFIFGCAIYLLSYLTLAGAAMSLDFPLVFDFTILSFMYYTLIYLLIYIFYRYSIYDRIMFLIKKEEDLIDFFLKIVSIFSCFCFLIFCYEFFNSLSAESVSVGEAIQKDLINPLQVVVQLSCFNFYFK